MNPTDRLRGAWASLLVAHQTIEAQTDDDTSVETRASLRVLADVCVTLEDAIVELDGNASMFETPQRKDA